MKDETAATRHPRQPSLILFSLGEYAHRTSFASVFRRNTSC